MTDLRADLPDDIVALLREADGADVVSAATRRAAWTQIEATLGGAAASTTIGAAATSMTKVVGVVAGVVIVVGVVGAVVGLGLARRAPERAATAPKVVAVAPFVPLPAAAQRVPPEPLETPATPPPAPTPAPVSKAMKTTPTTTTTTTTTTTPTTTTTTTTTPTTPTTADLERAVIEEARALLARSDLVGASAALDDHRRRYPRGALVEDRDALAVMLAWRRGDADAATVDAAFRGRYPQSRYTAAIARQRARAGRGQ